MVQVGGADEEKSSEKFHGGDEEVEMAKGGQGHDEVADLGLEHGKEPWGKKGGTGEVTTRMGMSAGSSSVISIRRCKSNGEYLGWDAGFSRNITRD